MCTFKSVVFIVFVLTICEVSSKNTKTKQSIEPPNISSQTNVVTTETSEPLSNKKIENDTVLNFDSIDTHTGKLAPIDSELHKLKNLIKAGKGEKQEILGTDGPENFGEFLAQEFKRADKNGNGYIDLEEYKVRLGEIAQRYFISKEEFTEDTILALFKEINKNNDGKSKDALDEEEFASLILYALEMLVKKLEALKTTPIEKIYNVRAYLEDLIPENHFRCDMIKSNNDAKEYIKQRISRIPFKPEFVDDVLKNLTGANKRTCQEIQKEIGDRLIIIAKPVQELLYKLSADANININDHSAPTSMLKSKKGRKSRSRKSRTNHI